LAHPQGDGTLLCRYRQKGRLGGMSGSSSGSGAVIVAVEDCFSRYQ